MRGLRTGPLFCIFVDMNTELMGRRNGAIDMLRGMTMFLMVAVNEFPAARAFRH